MNSISYILLTSGVQILGLIAFYFVHINYRKRQQLKFTAVVKRIMNVRTKEEFQQVFKRFANNEIRTLSYCQKNELLELADILNDNLI